MSQSNEIKVQPLTTPEAGGTPTAALSRRGSRAASLISSGMSLKRQVAVLAFWPMLEQLMAFLVGFVDTALAGHLGGQSAIDATNAVGASAYVVWLMGLLQGAVGVGATALIARSIGAKHQRQANAAVGQAVMLAAVWGLVVGIVFVTTAPMWGVMCGLKGEALNLCTAYLRLLAMIAPFMSVQFVSSACLRGAGDFKSPFAVMGVVNIINIVLSLLLVIGPDPWGGHGLIGIAYGTMVAWTIGAILMVRSLVRSRSGARLFLHRVRPHKAMMLRILKVGLPNLAENLLFWIGNFLVLMIVGRLTSPAEPVGSHMIAIRIEAFSFLPGFALSQAAATLVGQYLGSGQPVMARRSALMCLAYGGTIMCAVGGLFILIPGTLVLMVTNEPVFIESVPPLLIVAGWAQAGFATSMILSGALRGAGDTRTTLVITFISTYIIRLPIVWWLGMVKEQNLFVIWLVMSLDLILRGAMFAAYFLSGRWQKIHV